MPPGWRAALVDKSAKVIARIAPAARLGDAGPPETWPMPEGADAGEGAYTAASLAGEPALLAFSRSGFSEWAAVVEVPLALLHGPRRSAVQRILFSAGALLALGLSAAWWLRGRIDRSLGALRLAADAAGQRQHAAEARVHHYWEHTDGALFAVRVTLDGRFVLDGLNPAHEELTGLRSADVAGHEVGEFLPPDIAAAVAANYRRCVEAGAPVRYDETLELPGGRRDWETVLAPVRDPQTGRVALIVGSAREVTERRRAEAALRESDERFRAIADTMPGFVLTSVPGRGCDWVSAQFYELTGLPPGSAAGSGWTAALHPEDAPRVQEAWPEYVRIA